MLFFCVFAKQIPCLSAASFLNRTPIPHSHRLTIFRINTCKSLSKQTTLTSCRTIDLRKTEGVGGVIVRKGFFSGLALGSVFSLFAPRVFHNSSAIKRFHTLSENCRGVTLQFPIWELFAGHSDERPLFSSFPFNRLHTLLSSVSRKSFACHSYENCRVCTNNSQNGICQPAYRGQDYPSHRRALRLSNSSTLEPFNPCTIRPHFRRSCLFLPNVFYLSRPGLVFQSAWERGRSVRDLQSQVTSHESSVTVHRFHGQRRQRG